MIDTDVLRKKVLDLAIQGKLTEQLSSDGDAEELYAKIQEEKARLIKEGIIKKEKPLPEITEDEIPFEIPKSWKWVRLREISKKIIDGDHNPPIGVNYKTDYLMISAQNINNDRIENLESVKYLTEDIFLEENKRTNIEAGDVLLTIVATLGRSCVYRDNLKISLQRSVCAISTLIIPEYLKRYLDSSFVQKFMTDNATGAAQPGFYLNKVEKMYVPLPPIEEQKRIVEKIESIILEINNITSLQTKYIKDSVALKSKILDAAIRGKLIEQRAEEGTAEELYCQIQSEKAKLIKEGKIKKEKPLVEIFEDEIPFNIPKSWKWVRLASVLTVRGGRRIPAGRKLTKIPTSRIYIRVTDMQDGTILNNDLHYVPEDIIDGISKYIISKEDVYIVIVGSIGKCGLVPEEFSGMNLTENAARLTPYFVEKTYLYNVLSSSFMQNQFIDKTHQVGVPKLAINRLETALFPLPPLAEQRRIVARIEELLPLCERLAECREKA